MSLKFALNPQAAKGMRNILPVTQYYGKDCLPFSPTGPLYRLTGAYNEFPRIKLKFLNFSIVFAVLISSDRELKLLTKLE